MKGHDIKMKKKLVIAVAAALMLAACSNTGDAIENTATDTASETISVTEPETESEAATEEITTETEIVSEIDTEAETTEDVETDVYSGTGYTLNVDPEKWIDVIEYKQKIAETAEEINTELDFSADDYSEMCDAFWVYADLADSEFSANVNVVSQDIGADANMDADVLGPYMEESYSAVEGYTFLGWESVVINGSDCLKCGLEVEQSGITVRMQQYIFLKNGLQTVFTLTASDDSFETVLPDFEEMISTIYLD